MKPEGHTAQLAPLVEIAFDQDPISKKNLLLQESCARHVALLLVEENVQPVLTPLKKNRPFHPKAPVLVNLCGPPIHGGFNFLRCALFEASTRTTTGASAACLKLAQKPHLWAPNSLLPYTNNLDREALADLLPLPSLTLKPSFYQLTFWGEPIQASFLQGKIQTVCQQGRWHLAKKNHNEIALLQGALDNLSQKSRCPPQRLYGSLLALKKPETPTRPQILHTELNPNLHPESPWIQSLKATRLSYQNILRLALNFKEWIKPKVPA
jgi:hypothetical protein